jgi:hypothetical protein
VSTAEAGHPAWCPTDPTEAEPCPRCGATHGVQPKPTPPKVAAWMCTTCRMHWAVTAVNPPTLSVIGVLPTPQLRTTAFLAVLRTEVTRLAKEHPMPETLVGFPITELVNIDPMASVATVAWWCRLCGDENTATTRPRRSPRPWRTWSTSTTLRPASPPPEAPAGPPVEPSPRHAPGCRPVPNPPERKRRDHQWLDTALRNTGWPVVGTRQ